MKIEIVEIVCGFCNRWNILGKADVEKFLNEFPKKDIVCCYCQESIKERIRG